MSEPLFFDCLTDAQFWSLLDSGVLQAYLLPWEVYERLERIAPAHGCYLFTWPTDLDLPHLQDIIPSLAVPGREIPDQTYGDSLQTSVITDRLRSEIDAFCARAHSDMSTEGRRIHIISTNPDLELRTGPCLEPPARDLTAMSMPELEAYLDALLRVDDRNDVRSAVSSAYDPVTDRRSRAHP
jgi:hypothetical protein